MPTCTERIETWPTPNSLSVWVEVIYPTVGMLLCSHSDFDFKKACFEAYNRWIVTVLAVFPNRGSIDDDRIDAVDHLTDIVVEFSTQSGNANPNEQFLRGRVERRETSEYLQQLSNRELLADNRRKLTLFNGARNDIKPPWLWPNLFPDFDGDMIIEDYERRQFEADMRKLDLRRPVFTFGTTLDRDVDRDGIVEDPENPLGSHSHGQGDCPPE